MQVLQLWCLQPYDQRENQSQYWEPQWCHGWELIYLKPGPGAAPPQLQQGRQTMTPVFTDGGGREITSYRGTEFGSSLSEKPEEGCPPDCSFDKLSSGDSSWSKDLRNSWGQGQEYSGIYWLGSVMWGRSVRWVWCRGGRDWLGRGCTKSSHLGNSHWVASSYTRWGGGLFLVQ